MHFRLLVLSSRRIMWSNCLLEISVSQLYFQTCLRHSGAGSKTLRPLRVTSLTKRTEPGEAKALSHRERIKMFSEEDEDQSLEDLAAKITKYSSKFNAGTASDEHARHMIKLLKQNRARTIGNKFFREPVAPNLLTWAAKEQIRYLHSEDPEEWSVLALSELFPVCPKSIRKIIKSKVRFVRDDDVLRHNIQVQETWAGLKASLEDGNSSADDNVYQAFRNSHDEILIGNAAGVDDLPFPFENHDRFNPRGEFSVIVRDCYDIKEQKRQNMKEKILKQKSEFLAMLSDVTKMYENKTKGSKKGSIKSEEGNESFGTTRRIPQKVQVQQRQDGMVIDTYVSGECVYDKNGEFLYRVP